MVETREAIVYYSSATNRRYFTKSHAIKAHARALMEKHYPSEPAEYDRNAWVSDGYHWESDDDAVEVYKRLLKMIKYRMK